LAAAHRLEQALDETAAFAFAIGDSVRDRATVNVCAGPKAGSIMRAISSSAALSSSSSRRVSPSSYLFSLLPLA
jgi:hypothetical protein